MFCFVFRDVSLYEYVCTHMCGFIGSYPAKYFPVLVSITITLFNDALSAFLLMVNPCQTYGLKNKIYQWLIDGIRSQTICMSYNHYTKGSHISLFLNKCQYSFNIKKKEDITLNIF